MEDPKLICNFITGSSYQTIFRAHETVITGYVTDLGQNFFGGPGSLVRAQEAIGTKIFGKN